MIINFTQKFGADVVTSKYYKHSIHQILSNQLETIEILPLYITSAFLNLVFMNW